MPRSVKTAFFALVVGLLVPVGAAYGHGLGLDTASVDADGREISVTVELPMRFDAGEKQVTITATEEKTGESAKNVTFLVGLFHGGEMILRNYFFAEDGRLAINVIPADTDGIEIRGRQGGPLDAWSASDGKQLEISGPVFQTGGLYTFEIEIRTIDEPDNIIETREVSRADLSVIDTAEFVMQDGDIVFGVKSYFERISDFAYDPETRTVTFEMPFDWSEKAISHVPVIHEELHFPKDFAAYNSPSYTGAVHGIELFKSSVTIDDYTEEGGRIVHVVLLADHLRVLKNQLGNAGRELPQNIVFTLTASEENLFPMSAYTAGEQFRVDLSWEPEIIEPEEEIDFIFTIRDGATGEPLRRSTYDFVVVQNGEEIYRVHDEATVGGSFERYAFSAEQTGSTVIKFEDIRGTGARAEFGLVVVPEFGAVALLALFAAMALVVFNGRLVFPKM